MNKNLKIATLSGLVAGIAVGATTAQASPLLGASYLGRASELRSALVRMNSSEYAKEAEGEKAEGKTCECKAGEHLDKSAEGKCGEGKCAAGGEMAEDCDCPKSDAESNEVSAADSKDSEGKCGEGKCG